MCFQVRCKDCKRASWAGCGMHIQSALAGVDEESRCNNWRKGGPCGQKGAGAADSGASPSSGGGIFGKCMNMSDELETTTAQEETHKTVEVQPKPSPVDALPKTLTLETSQGNIVIELRPNQALESVQYIKKLLDSPKPCKGCRFYRAEQRGILQGILHKEDIPANEVLGTCPDDVEEKEKCHGPMMKAGMVGWAAGEGGPDFFIDNYDRLADWWGHDHTVWGEITDSESLKVVDSFFDLPRTKRGLTYLDTHVPITMK